MCTHTKYSHLTDNELIRMADAEAVTDLEKELLARFEDAVNYIEDMEDDA